MALIDYYKQNYLIYIKKALLVQLTTALNCNIPLTKVKLLLAIINKQLIVESFTFDVYNFKQLKYEKSLKVNSTEYTQSLVFTNHKKLILSSNQKIIIIDTSAWQIISVLDIDQKINGSIYSQVEVNENLLLITTSKAYFMFWDLKICKCVNRVISNHKVFHSLIKLRNGKFAFHSRNKTLKLFEVINNDIKIIGKIESEQMLTPKIIELSNDRIALFSFNHIEVFDLNSFTQIEKYTGSCNTIGNFIFLLENDLILLGGNRGSALFDFNAKKFIYTMSLKDKIITMEYLGNGVIAAACSRGVIEFYHLDLH